MILPHDAPTGSAAVPLDLGLIRRHAIAGPRYTSYPPANRFTTDLAALDVDAALAADNAPGAGPISLYVHLPFCQSHCWYCGCNTVVTRRQSLVDSYLDDIEREIALYAARVDCQRPVVQLHLGGGTPTFLSAAQLARLATLLRHRFHFAPDAEIGVEIDPRHLEPDQLDSLATLGVNRASLGIQDTDTSVQLAIHRLQPHRLNRTAVQLLRAAGIRSINLDLIYGLPLQTPETFGRTLDDALELGPDRLSVFGYAHVPWIRPAQRVFEQRHQLPGPEARLALFALAHQRLTAAGYVDIGLDHFARPDDELAHALRAGTLQRNFQGYSTRAGASLYGFGLSSISSTADTYRQNVKGLDEYHAALAEDRLPLERGLRLTDEDRARRSVIMRLMCERRLDFGRLAAELGVDPRLAFASELESLSDLTADGIVEIDDHGIRVTPAGVPLLRVVAMRFDKGFTPAARAHSMAI